MQKNIISGNISTDIDFDSEKKVAKFSIADDIYRGKDDDGKAKKDVVYLPITAFKHHAEVIANNCKKGDQLIIEYQISNNNYEKDGNKTYGFNFVVKELDFGRKAK